MRLQKARSGTGGFECQAVGLRLGLKAAESHGRV